jgi:DNA adenine methylase
MLLLRISLFISAKNKRFTTAYISDINSELINSYIAVKDNVERLTELLKLHEIEYKKAPVEYYYNLRSNHNLSDSTERAARFIALNRTCFNGLYRVNSNGMFNVPIGKYKNPTICNSSNLRNVSLALHHSNAIIKTCDYKEMLLENAKEGDFYIFGPALQPRKLNCILHKLY